MVTVLVVGIGGAIGAIMRWWTGILFNSVGLASYLSTLSVNFIGSFLIGLVFITLQNKYPSGELIHSGIMIGLLGGFTKYSAFSLEVVNMIASGLLGRALMYIFITLICCLAAAFVGTTVGRAL